jgi:Tol biopolymer transport system component
MIINNIQLRKTNFTILISSIFILSITTIIGCGSGGGGECTTPTPTPTSSPTPTPTPSDLACVTNITRKIAFQSYGINIMNADGSNRIKLTTSDSNGANGDLDPALSPDGTQVAFVRTVGSKSQLMLVNADGTNLRQIRSSTHLRAPQWHPNGTKIIYSVNASPSVVTFMINADGTRDQQLIEAGDGQLAAWSPDGKKLAFVSSRAGAGRDIYTMNADGSELLRVTNTDDYSEWSPRWSPDGKKIVCYGDYTFNTANSKMYLLNADGSGRTSIGPEKGRRPSWSQDGTKIIFCAPVNGDSNYEILTMNPNGSDVCNLTNSTESEFNPSW